MRDDNQAIGLFGGTFDPIHLGHIHSLAHAAEVLGLGQIRVLPCKLPPHKQAPGVTVEHRLAMASLAIAPFDFLILDDYELNAPEPSYTVNTLRHFKRPNNQLYFFIGMDSLLSFHQWHEYQRILSLAHLVVLKRPGYALDAQQLLPELSKKLTTEVKDLQKSDAGRILLLDNDQRDVSSTQIRRLLQTSDNWSQNLGLSEEVFAYIKQHKLYGA